MDAVRTSETSVSTKQHGAKSQKNVFIVVAVRIRNFTNTERYLNPERSIYKYRYKYCSRYHIWDKYSLPSWYREMLAVITRLAIAWGGEGILIVSKPVLRGSVFLYCIPGMDPSWTNGVVRAVRSLNFASTSWPQIRLVASPVLGLHFYCTLAFSFCTSFLCPVPRMPNTILQMGK
jgi:hypothetical protein